MLNVVYDVDDVLNNLNEYVFNLLNLSPPDRFNIYECNYYTDEQKRQVMEAYKSWEIFTHLQFVPGASEICDIEKTRKAIVWINSNNFTEEIAQIKYKSLTEYIPSLNKERIIMQIMNGDTHVTKECIPSTDIIVEDCLLNLSKYGKDTYKILIDKTYNKSESYGSTDKDLGIIRVKDLLDANRHVEKIVQQIRA